MPGASWALGVNGATLLEVEDCPGSPGLTWGVWAEAWQGPQQKEAHWEVCFDDRRSVHGVRARGTASDLNAAMQAAEAALPPLRESFQLVKLAHELRTVA